MPDARSSTIADDQNILDQRRRSYNAEVLGVVRVHEGLRILRIRPDVETPGFLPGQYTVLGLGYWEPRIAGLQCEELDPALRDKMVKRAYSFSCPMLGDDGRLLPPAECDFLEFYIALIHGGEGHPCGLTPRLFALAEGDRLFVGSKVTGHYTLQSIRPDDDVIFVATGTGEAPHNAMIAHLLANHHQGQLVAVTCVRQKRDLGYLDTHRELERRYPNYRYLTLTTREPENLDASLPNYIGKRYLQDFFESGDFERDARVTLDPTKAHVFLCGNPAMIGVPRRGDNPDQPLPEPLGMVSVLARRGFKTGEAGNIHFEKYW